MINQNMIRSKAQTRALVRRPGAAEEQVALPSLALLIHLLLLLLVYIGALLHLVILDKGSLREGKYVWVNQASNSHLEEPKHCLTLL